MAVNVADLFASVSVDASRVGPGLASVRAAFSGHLEQLSGISARFSTIIGAAFAGAAAIGSAGFLKAAVDAERSQARLSALVAATGSVAGFSASQLEEMAEKLRGVGTEGLPGIRAAQAELLKFTQVRGDVFARALGVALDQASLSGQSLASVAAQMGRALEDPARGMMFLRRQGIILSQEQQQQVKQMAAFGDVAGAQGLLLDVFASKVKGGAAAMAGTFGGGIALMQRSLTELSESFGRVLMPLFGPIVSGIRSMAEYLTRLEPTLSAFSTRVASALGRVFSVLGGLFTGFNEQGPTLEGVLDAVAGAFERLAAFVEENRDTIESFRESLAAVAGGVAVVVGLGVAFGAVTATVTALASPFGVLIGLMTAGVALANHFGIDWGETLNGAIVMVQNLGLTWEIVTTKVAVWLSQTYDAVHDLFAGIVAAGAGAWEAMKGGLTALWEWVKRIVGAMVDSFKGFFGGVGAGWEAIKHGENPFKAFGRYTEDALRKAKDDMRAGAPSIGGEMAKGWEKGLSDGLSRVFGPGGSPITKALQADLDNLLKKFDDLRDKRREPKPRLRIGDAFGPFDRAEGPAAPTAEMKVKYSFAGAVDFAKELQKAITGTAGDNPVAVAKDQLGEARKQNDKLDRLLDSSRGLADQIAKGLNILPGLNFGFGA